MQPALSTMWMQNRHRSLEEFFEAASQLGFERFELNYFVSHELVQTAHFPAEAIQSVHAPCPTHPRTRDAEMSSLDKDERASAVEATTASIELAERLGASVVILHTGVVPLQPELDTRLRHLYNTGQVHTREYADLRAEVTRERAQQAERHLDSTRRSLERLATIADSAGIRLGIENRFAYNEIPIPDELDMLLSEFAGPVGFWLDTGHAYVLEELGFIPHTEWLTGFGQHVIGAHLHDVHTVDQPVDANQPAVPSLPLRDHDMPGSGVVDFAEVFRSIPASALFTCEFETYHEPDKVRAGLQYLKNLPASATSSR